MNTILQSRLKLLLILWAGLGLWSAGPLGAQPHGQPQPPATAAGQLDEMVVIEQRIADYLKNHPRQVSVLERAELRERNFLQVSEALNALPGVDIQPSGTGLGYRISIRGSGSGGRVLVLINGRPAGTGQYGSADIDTIPIALVKRIEVFKPPVPVWLGPGGSAGAINIVVESKKPDSPRKTTHSGRMQVRGGSFGTAGAKAAHVVTLPGQRLTLSAASARRDGRRTNSDRNTGRAGLSWHKALGSVTKLDLNSRFYQSRHGSPGRTDNPTPDARQTYKKGALDMRLRGLAGAAWDYTLKTYADALRLTDRSQSGLTSTLDTRLFGVKGEADWATGDEKTALRLGGNLDGESADHTLTGLHRRSKAALHGRIDQQWRDYTVSVGGRWDHSSDFGSFPAVNAGISRRLGDAFVVKLNTGINTNIPTFGQLYQPSHGSIDIVRGNPDLSEERVWTTALGLHWQQSPERLFALTGFRENTDDKIAYQDYPDAIKRPVNIESAYRQGIECYAKWPLGFGLDLDAGYTWQRTRITGTGHRLPYAAEHQARLTGKYAVSATATRLELSLRAYSDRYSDLQNSELKKVAAYLNVDARATQPVTFRKLKTELFVQLNNLLDRNFASHYGYPDNGFRVQAGINLNY